MINFRILDSRYTIDSLGLIPHFLSQADGRSAKEQFHDNYSHGGGWSPLRGWELGPTGEIMFREGGETYSPIAVASLHETEIIRVYPSAWVSIAQPDGQFEVSRMD